MRVAIHQPHYLPYLGYFDKLDAADVFVVLDTVQFAKHDWQNRNRIRTKDGWQWLTVPVIDRFPQRIGQVEINGRTDWPRKHGQALRLHYGGCRFWGALGPPLVEMIQRPWRRLCELNLATLDLLCEQLAIRTPRVLASTLRAREDPTDRLIDLTRSVGGTVYLTGQLGPAYMDLARFAQAGIAVEVQAYRHPEYPQRYAPFLPGLSVLDLLFNCGPESLTILRAGRRWGPAKHPGGASRGDAET